MSSVNGFLLRTLLHSSGARRSKRRRSSGVIAADDAFFIDGSAEWISANGALGWRNVNIRATPARPCFVAALRRSSQLQDRRIEWPM